MLKCSFVLRIKFSAGRQFSASKSASSPSAQTLAATITTIHKLRIMLTFKDKTEQIKYLTNYLLEKYGKENIILTDYWDSDNMAIGLADKTKNYTVYISDYGKSDNTFFVSLENPTESNELPYSIGEDFDNQTMEEVENIVVKHLRISRNKNNVQ